MGLYNLFVDTQMLILKQQREWLSEPLIAKGMPEAA